jgi:hypothetical protein
MNHAIVEKKSRRDFGERVPEVVGEGHRGREKGEQALGNEAEGF